MMHVCTRFTMNILYFLPPVNEIKKIESQISVVRGSSIFCYVFFKNIISIFLNTLLIAATGYLSVSLTILICFVLISKTKFRLIGIQLKEV